MRYIYLDQNKWIDLAKADCGKPDAVRFRPVLDSFRKAVGDGKVIFPLSGIHMMETAKSRRADQRLALAELMTELSQGVVLRSEREMARLFLDRAVCQCFGQMVAGDKPIPFARGPEEAFGFDFLAVAGIREEIKPQMRHFLDSPTGWLDLLSYGNEPERKAGIEAVQAIGINAATESENRRAKFGQDLGTFRRTYAARLTLELMQPLTAALQRIGQTFQEWGALGPERLMQFWSSIPCLHVELELHSQMHNEKSKKWKPNDVMDIGALSIAIPACDAVVTEKFWIRIAEKCSLHQHYKTRFYSDLVALTAEL